MNKIEYAKKYASHGLKIFPLWWAKSDGKCACGKPDCDRPGKHTIYDLAPHSHLNATDDLAIINRWWLDAPNANIGMACSASGLIVVDIDIHDGKSNGFESLEDLEYSFGEKFGDPSAARVYSTVTQNTGSGGQHLFFKSPDWLETCPGNLGKNFPSIDLKFNGFVLLEPSNHKSGGLYSFEKNDNGECVSLNNLLSGNIPPLGRTISEFIKEKQSSNYSAARYTAPRRDLDFDDYDQIRDALQSIPFHGIDYDDKLKVGMALQHTLPGGDGKELYFDWLQSNLGSKFKIRQSEKHWRSFKFRSGGRTIASLFDIAAQFGWENEGKRGTYIDPEDYIFMTPTLIAQEVKTDDVMFICNSNEIISEAEARAIEYCIDNNLPDGSMFVDYSIINYPNNGFSDYQKTFIIEYWNRNGVSDDVNLDFIRIPDVEINYPVFLDFDSNGNLIELINENYVSPRECHQLATANAAQSIPMTGSNMINEKLFQIANRTKDDNVGWPSEEDMANAHAQLGNIPPLCALYDWHVQRSPQYAHKLSLAFALITVSSILAGRFSFEGLTTNLYAVVIAPTSIGKTVLLNLIGEVLRECGELQRMGPKDIISDKGFYNDLKDNRAKLFPIDEWGQLQKEIFSERANSSQRLIRRTLLAAFSAFSTPSNKTASRANEKDGKSVELGPLCPSVFGISTEREFYDTLNYSFISDGFLTRFLLMEITKESLLPGKETSSNNEASKQSFMSWFNQVRSVYKAPSMAFPEWDNARCDTNCVTEMAISSDSRAILSAIKEIEVETKNRDDDMGNIFARLREITIRVSIIFEICSRPFSKVIEKDSVELAFELVHTMLQGSYKTARERISPNSSENVIRDLMAYFRRVERPIMYNEIREKTTLREISGREARELIGEMCMRGLLKRFRPKQRRRGTPALIYVASSMRQLCDNITQSEEYEEC